MSRSFKSVYRSGGVMALQGAPSIGAKLGEQAGGWIEDQMHEQTEEIQQWTSERRGAI